MKRWHAVVELCVAAVGLSSVGGKESAAGAADPRPPTVVLVTLGTSDSVATEAMSRVNGELKAAGFDVAIVSSTSDDAKHDLETAGRERNPIAAFAIFVRPAEGGASIAEIWVSDRIRQKIVIQNAVLRETDQGRGSEVLAVRAVEVLKANFAAFWTPAPPSPSDSVPAIEPPSSVLSAGERAEQRARFPFASGLGVGLGAGWTARFGEAGPTWSPDATVSYGWPNGFSLRASFVGLGPAATLSTANGHASVAEQLATLEAVKTWWARSALVPFVTAGAGTAHVHVVGVGVPPYQGHTSEAWSLLTTAGVGLGIPIVSTLSIVVQPRGIIAWSSAVVQVAGADAGRVGTPSLLGDAGLFGTLP